MAPTAGPPLVDLQRDEAKMTNVLYLFLAYPHGLIVNRLHPEWVSCFAAIVAHYSLAGDQTQSPHHPDRRRATAPAWMHPPGLLSSQGIVCRLSGVRSLSQAHRPACPSSASSI